MALKKCSECDKEISTKAEKCPHCGAPGKKPTSGCAMLVVILFGVIFIVYVASPSGNPPPPTPEPASAPAGAPSARNANEPDDIEAWTMAQMFVKDQLKAPSTADFGSVLGDYQSPHKNVTKEVDGTYLVRIWVDAQNTFGAQIRTHYLLRLRHNGGDSWSMVGPPVTLPQ